MTLLRVLGCLLLCISWLAKPALAQLREIPAALEPWKNWVLWDQTHRDCPTPFHAAGEHICFWPSRLTLTAEQGGGSWTIQVQVFGETWVPLPGDGRIWPFSVTADEQPLPVISRSGVPSVRLPAGVHNLSGEFHWQALPQRVAVPRQVGILTLNVHGQPVAFPNWDAEGNVWLQRVRVEEAQEDRLAVQVYRVLEDGIPLWLRSELDLEVSGKSREEQLGWLLPEGWHLSWVESPLPVAVDEAGRIKAQVRAGSWKILVHAFRNTDLGEMRFAAGAEPVVSKELIGFRARPDFRMAEIQGIPAVDVNQTTFPAPWRDLQVFEWQTVDSLRLVEKMRGMGTQRPRGLAVERHLWLDEDGHGVTYRDRISGQLQQIWRLDVAEGQQLGAVRAAGEPQLITANPVTDAAGVEVRNRELQLEAIGRAELAASISATGWRTDVESLRLTLSLPPGWRVFSLFGADTVDGDWLTAWSLLDLFLLLIFALAVFRMWGAGAGAIALLAFGLSYHEPGSPRLTWLFLLIPIALLRVVGEGSGRRWLKAWKFLAVALLMVNLIPFAIHQVQSTIYPQLESVGIPYRARSMFEWLGGAYERGTSLVDYVQEDAKVTEPALSRLSQVPEQSNLLFEPSDKIQTGPAEPEWDWNQVNCSWSGPVAADQQITVVLISRPVHQAITVARLVLLMLLAGVLCGVCVLRLPRWGRRAAPATLGLVFLVANTAVAQIPDQQMLNTLRERLLEPSDAYPLAADIAQLELTLDEGMLSMRAEVHAAKAIAVPLPGRLPSWSPLTVTIDGEADVLVCRREDGYLWVMVPAGVHKVTVEGLLADAAEWELTFLLAPRQVSIHAPEWNVTGVRANGVPDEQILLDRREQTPDSQAAYDQKYFRAIAAMNRRLEVGLQWRVHNTLTRLSEPGKAVSLRIPLLPGESVLTSNLEVLNGAIEVNLGANEHEVRWESILEPTGEIALQAVPTDQWVERWHLISSPVWHVEFEGLAPIYDMTEERLIPVWHPWPGEGVRLTFRKPEAIRGETITVQRVAHQTTLGARRRNSTLTLQVQASLGTDFAVEFDAEAAVSSLAVGTMPVPVRRDGGKLLVPLRPGPQSVEVAWSTEEELGTNTRIGAVNLPVAGANISTTLVVPEDRWILWAGGPLRGPAVRFWTILVTAVLLAVMLGSVSLSPLRRIEWVLLALGLTQVHVAAAMLVVGWLFLLAWRGQQEPGQFGFFRFNLLQLLLILLTLIAFGIFIVVVGQGLLGNPHMFIVGNGSWGTTLRWFQPRSGTELPQPHVVSISVWYYRLLMLLWALWLANGLLRWLRQGWKYFSHGGCWKRWRRKPPVVQAEIVEPMGAS